MATNNSSVRPGAIENAEEIIERFGGIRPMAAKIDTPVTTVQGWKKRNVIPGTRRADIMAAAKDLKIDLSDVMSSEGVSNQNAPKKVKASKSTKKTPVKAPKSKSAGKAKSKKEKLPSPYDAVEAKAQAEPKPEGIKAIVKEQKAEQTREEKSAKKSADKSETKVSANHQVKKEPVRSTPKTDADVLTALENSNRKTLINTIWIVTALFLLSALVLSLFFWPQAKVIEEQQQTISDLQTKVDDVDKKTSLLGSVMPQDMKNSWNEIKTRTQNDLTALQNQAKNTQIALEQLKDRTAAISNGVIGADAGPLSQRLSVIEEQLAAMNGGGENGRFASLIERIQNLEATVPGQMQFKDSIGELQTIVDGLDGQVNTLEGRLEEAQGSEGALGQTLEGVSGNDLKAAAMLIAFSQLRDSLNREGSFEEDLILLDKMVGEDNVELKTAIAELAPHAQQGVLTRKGLSKEFRGLAGDIVVSSLKGEDISIKERAKARLNDVMTIEKDGELVTGTQTQATVAKAQAMLDAGDIQGAMAELQTLEGGAAEQAQPFMGQLKATLQAEETQQLLRNSILSKVTGQLGNLGGGLNGMTNALSGQIPAMPNMPNMPTMPAQGLPGVPSMNPQAIMNSIQGAMPNASGLNGAEGFNMDDMKKTLEENITPNEVVRDEESGFAILPKQQGFKGFSAGQR